MLKPRILNKHTYEALCPLLPSATPTTGKHKHYKLVSSIQATCLHVQELVEKVVFFFLQIEDQTTTKIKSGRVL